MSNPSEIHLNENQAKRFLKFIFGDDLDFYEEHLMDLTDDEFELFLDENPDFLSEFPVDREHMFLLKDHMFRGLLRKIKRYQANCEDEKPKKIMEE